MRAIDGHVALLLADTTLGVFGTHSRMMPDLITVKADGVVTIFVEVVTRITTTAGGWLAIVFHPNLILSEAQKTGDLSLQFHTQVTQPVEDIRVALHHAATHREDPAITGQAMFES